MSMSMDKWVRDILEQWRRVPEYLRERPDYRRMYAVGFVADVCDDESTREKMVAILEKALEEDDLLRKDMDK